MMRAGVILCTWVVALIATTGPATAAPTQDQQFTITEDVSAGVGTVVASGAINATGSDFETGFMEAGRTGHSTDVFVFDDGTIDLKVKGVDRSTFDESTCTATVYETGNYVITRGTGAYVGIKGSGQFTVSGTVQFEQTADGCNFDTPTGTVTVDAPGKVKL